MPVFLITIHAYRSWGPDHPKGFVRESQGILPRDKGLARAYSKNASSPPTLFDDANQQTILTITRDATSRRAWRLHALACEPTHVHLLVSWFGDTRSITVCAKLKNLISRELNLGLEKKRRWLSRGASRRRVQTRDHFAYLLNVYLPKHSGLVWVEGEGTLPTQGDQRPSGRG